MGERWTLPMSYGYVLLHPAADPDATTRQITDHIWHVRASGRRDPSAGGNVPGVRLRVAI